jgi:hypothetical protein
LAPESLRLIPWLSIIYLCLGRSKYTWGKYPSIIFCFLLLSPFLGHDFSIVLTSSPLLFSGCDLILGANTLLLHFVFYYYPFFLGRDTLVVLASSLFLPSGRNLIFRANTPYYILLFIIVPFLQAVIFQ